MSALAPFLFDLDGTLADTLPDIAASANHVRALHGLPALPLSTMRTFVGDGARTLVRHALAEVLPAEHDAEAAVDAAFARYVAHHDEQCTVHAMLFAGVEAHLEHLRAQGHRLAVVTNKAERFARPVVAHLGLNRWIDVIVGGDTVARKKPDPAPLHHALAALGGAASGTMVGDGVQDLRAGKAAGLTTVGCLFGYGDPEALRREGATAFWSAFGRTAEGVTGTS